MTAERDAARAGGLEDAASICDDDDQGLASDLNQAYDIVVILANAATPDAL